MFLVGESTSFCEKAAHGTKYSKHQKLKDSGMGETLEFWGTGKILISFDGDVEGQVQGLGS